MFRKLFQMQYLNSLMKLNRRLTRSCRLGIALTSWTRLNFVKLAPAHTNACFGLTLSRENALTMRPGITGAAQWRRLILLVHWNRELRACPDLCTWQRMEGLWRRNGGHWRWWCTHCHQLPWESVWIETQEFYSFVRFALYLIVGPLLIYLFLLLKKSQDKMSH